MLSLVLREICFNNHFSKDLVNVQGTLLKALLTNRITGSEVFLYKVEMKEYSAVVHVSVQ